MEENYITIEGTVERIVYQNQENDYTVIRFTMGNGKELHTAVGIMYGINEGESVRLTGNWDHNPKFGRQFSSKSFETILPTDESAIEKLLASRLIKGIGPVYAKKIVDRYGKETLDIIEHRVAKLKEIDGIGDAKIQMIEKAWKANRELKNVMLGLASYGISGNFAVKMYKAYGSDAANIVKKNPYRLADDIWGIGFKTADKLALKLGFEHDSPIRIKAYLMFLLSDITNNGHVCYPREDILEKAVSEINIERELIETCLEDLIRINKVIPYSIDDIECIYNAKLYYQELGIAKKILEMLDYKYPPPSINLDKEISVCEKKFRITLAPEQVDAVKTAAASPLMIITGGPGTGKTTIIKTLLYILKKQTPRIMLAAPTGRAAKRMEETTGWKAKTIHRLLEYSPGKEDRYGKNPDNRLKADIIIIDEFSMVDVILFNGLLKAIPDSTRLILVGDKDQLPSVGPGNLLSDLLSFGKIPKVFLNHIFRQAQQSKIVINAHRVNNGKMVFTKQQKDDKLSDFYFIEEEEPEKAVQTIIKLCSQRIPKRFGFDPVNSIQLLCPMNKGLAGAYNLNLMLQETLNPGDEGIMRGNIKIKPGDKVMQIRNNYDKDVFNGDIGIVNKISDEENLIEILFDKRPVRYENSELDELVLSYAITIHKSQGSEYPAVIIPILTQHYIMLQRNLLYTGITRGKKLVILVGSTKALFLAINNDKQQQRYSGLLHTLKMLGS